jgi:hypothetical protein
MRWHLLNAPNADIKKKAGVSPRNALSVGEKRPLRRNRGIKNARAGIWTQQDNRNQQ